MSDAGELTSKLSGEFSAAKERVRTMQQAAEDRHRRLLEGYQQFLRSAQQVKDLLTPRVEGPSDSNSRSVETRIDGK